MCPSCSTISQRANGGCEFSAEDAASRGALIPRRMCCLPAVRPRVVAVSWHGSETRLEKSRAATGAAESPSKGPHMKILNWGVAAASSLVLAGLMASPGAAAGGNARFSDFTPLPSSAGPDGRRGRSPSRSGTLRSSSGRSPDRKTQLAAGEPNSGVWDMITVNETGPHKGSFLFTLFETDQSGIQRTDLATGEPRRSGTARRPEATSPSTPPTGRRGAPTSRPRRRGAPTPLVARPVPTDGSSSSTTR